MLVPTLDTAIYQRALVLFHTMLNYKCIRARKQKAESIGKSPALCHREKPHQCQKYSKSNESALFFFFSFSFSSLHVGFLFSDLTQFFCSGNTMENIVVDTSIVKEERVTPPLTPNYEVSF